MTDYELAALAVAQLSKQHRSPTKAFYETVADGLTSFGLLFPSKDFKPGTVFHMFGRSKPKAMEVACAVDPFAYVSHLSAMEYHGLTDRFSKILCLTTPPDGEWRELAKSKMEKDLREQVEAHRKAKLPTLRRLSAERIEGLRVELIRRSSRGAFKAIKAPAIRVAMIGTTFLDMLREPGSCGGMQHVVDVYRQHGPRYLSLLTEEIDRHGNAIEKVRAGYLLDEVCHLQHPLMDGWLRHAQRGGSRRLDPQGEYAPDHSEKWKLSINVASLVPGDSEDAS